MKETIPWMVRPEREALPSPTRRRACIDRVRAELNASERRACGALRHHRSTQRKGPADRAEPRRLSGAQPSLGAIASQAASSNRMIRAIFLKKSNTTFTQCGRIGGGMFFLRHKDHIPSVLISGKPGAVTDKDLLAADMIELTRQYGRDGSPLADRRVQTNLAMGAGSPRR